ncbi:ABC transporter permease [Oryzibacter oryziterrae]|uniref:ABC transporter permease n=1 Tax=Oryzibacter oryziterrae TaxID=2766474 RepID=UPI001F24B2C5|nr:ABC transporter permease [Oryzibacter oryziterrae]
MTFFDLSRKNAWRKPLRTVLLVVSIAVAFLIYGLTASFLAGSQGTAGASDDILGVTSASGRGQPLPMSLLARIGALPDVAALSYYTRLRGFVGTEKNVVAVSATDIERLLPVSGQELGLTPALIDAIRPARDRVLVGRALADAQGWAVGQRVAVTAFDLPRDDGSRDWRFEIAGIFEGQSASTDTYFMIARYDYVNAARARGKDSVDGFALRPHSGISPSTLAAKVDALFANSATPTRTQSERQFLEAFLRQYADIGLIVNLVVGASFITLLMIVINTMVFAVRERTFEIGVLKTLGFSRGAVMALVLAETLFVFALGGAMGLGLAKLATVLVGSQLGLVFSLPVLGKGLAILLAVSLATGLLPAINAMRTPVATAFRTR